MYLYWILLLVIIIICCIIPRIEHYEEEDGVCECCGCGFMSCVECKRKSQQCCKGFGYDRFTFSHYVS